MNEEINAISSKSYSSDSNKYSLNIFNDSFVKYLKGNISKLVKDKVRSKILQKLVSKFSQDIINLVFEEVFSNLLNEIKNDYSNYFFQKFFKMLNKGQAIRIVKLFEKVGMFELSKLPEGVYLIVSLLSRQLSSEEQDLIYKSFQPYLLMMLTEDLSYKILIKIILKYPEDYFSEVYQIILSNFTYYAKIKSSNEVIKIILSKQNISINISESIATLVTENLQVLSKHKIANSVVVACLFVRILF